LPGGDKAANHPLPKAWRFLISQKMEAAIIVEPFTKDGEQTGRQKSNFQTLKFGTGWNFPGQKIGPA
jgi:hypothetical protein